MRRCILSTSHLGSGNPPAGRVWRCQVTRAGHQRRGLVDARVHDEVVPKPILPKRYKNYAIFKKISPPEKGSDANSWVTLLEPALPPHLRQHSQDPQPVTLNAVDVAEILLAAQYPVGAGRRADAVDLLYHIGFEQGRWSAAVWLIKKLVEHFPVPQQRSDRFNQLARHWNDGPSLKVATDQPIHLEPSGECFNLGSLEKCSLDELTSGATHNLTRQGILQQDALGQVWRSLGAMTVACAGGEIKAEVLEIIAYLHHQEIMPQSIYQYSPNSDRTAVQQPPFLPLLSSRILTSLSDAAWRAHEKLVIDEAKARGGQYEQLRPEIPGAVYRVNVAGLRPEVWTELILWSCLHGGWILQGAEILNAICRAGSTSETWWKPMSWREYETLQRPHGNDLSRNDWNYWDYLFKTTAASARDETETPHAQTRLTVSSEVVNAYVESLVSSVNVGVDEKGSDLRLVLDRLHAFSRFLNRANLSLSTGSWDALVLRLVEISAVDITQNAAFLQICVDLLPAMGNKLGAHNLQDLPAYVLDGTAALQGLMLRSLQNKISSGSLNGALAVFRDLQSRVDAEKQQSLVNFFTGRRRALKMAAGENMFTANFSGIDCPSLNLDLPPTISGPFLDLVTSAKAHNLGRWLLYSDDVDGPTIPPSQYDDPHLQPALFRFAIETNDVTLLADLRKMTVSETTYRTILDIQINKRRWDAAERVLDHISATRGVSWGSNISNLARVMLTLQHEMKTGDTTCEDDLMHAKGMFLVMIRPQHDAFGRVRDDSVESLLCLLSAIDEQWADLCQKSLPAVKYHDLVYETAQFNMVLEGAVLAYGATFGRHLVDQFYPVTPRQLSPEDQSRRADRVGQRGIRTTVPIPGRPGKQMVLYNAQEPSTATFLIILKRALADHAQQSDRSFGEDAGPSMQPLEHSSAQDIQDVADASFERTITWAVDRMLQLSSFDEILLKQLDAMLAEHGLTTVRDHLQTDARLIHNIGGEEDLTENERRETGI